MRGFSESFSPERFHPSLTPGQAETIIASSNTLGCWVVCKRAACRRRRACSGFSGRNIPPCVLQQLAHFGVCLDAIGALIPHRPVPSEREAFNRQIRRIQKRIADCLELTAEEMLRSAETDSDKRRGVR